MNSELKAKHWHQRKKDPRQNYFKMNDVEYALNLLKVSTTMQSVAWLARLFIDELLLLERNSGLFSVSKMAVSKNGLYFESTSY